MDEAQQKANRKLWVEALRSGKYKQGKEWLIANGAYCCLGVLAKCAGYPSGDLAGCGTLSGFPRALEFVGLTSDIGDYGNTTLCDRNDKGASFAEIADIIESEPAGLFAA